MKVLTLNFLTCAVKACKTKPESFPLHPKDAELVSDDVEINSQLLINLLPRLDWNALRITATEVSQTSPYRIVHERQGKGVYGNGVIGQEILCLIPPCSPLFIHSHTPHSLIFIDF